MNATDKDMEDIRAELASAREKFPRPFHSFEEGLGIMLEEISELWDEIRAKQGGGRNLARMRKEAIQVGAMALRMIEDMSFRGGIDRTIPLEKRLNSAHEGFVFIRNAYASSPHRVLSEVRRFLRDICASEEAVQR